MKSTIINVKMGSAPIEVIIFANNSFFVVNINTDDIINSVTK